VTLSLTPADVPGLPERLLTAREVAAIVGVSPKRVYELGIPAVHISDRSLRWRPSTVAAWIAEREAA
jgi:predicted DNA-binding transcriptional regulator AlpA